MINYNIFRERISSLMRSHGTLSKDLADAIGITKTSMSRYLNGARNPDVEYLARFAGFYNTSIDYLLGLNDDDFLTGNDEELKKILDLYRIATEDDKLIIKTLLSKYE